MKVTNSLNVINEREEQIPDRDLYVYSVNGKSLLKAVENALNIRRTVDE